jgi:hypothetical protein
MDVIYWNNPIEQSGKEKHDTVEFKLWFANQTSQDEFHFQPTNPVRLRVRMDFSLILDERNMFRFISFLTQAVYWSGVFRKFIKKATGPPQQKKNPETLV